jgi:hypothetical protein
LVRRAHPVGVPADHAFLERAAGRADRAGRRDPPLGDRVKPLFGGDPEGAELLLLDLVNGLFVRGFQRPCQGPGLALGKILVHTREEDVDALVLGRRVGS